jgi:hypothetical protein
MQLVSTSSNRYGIAALWPKPFTACPTRRGQEACAGPWRAFRPVRQQTAHQRQEALQRLAAGETQTDIARSYNVSHVTIGRLQGPFSDCASASAGAAAAA